MKPAPIRIMLVTTIMAPYRVPVFNALAAIDGVTLSVIYLSETAPHRSWNINHEDMNHDYAVLRERYRIDRDNTWMHFSTGLRREAGRWKPDVMLLGGWDQPAFIDAFRQRRRRGYGVALWVESNARDARRPSLISSSLKRRAVAVAGGIAVPGRASSKYVEQLGARPDVIFQAPNAVDTDFFTSRAPVSRAGRDAKPRVLYVGRLHPVKGLDSLLNAWRALEDAGELVLVGEGSLEAHLQTRIRTEGIEGVTLLGHLQRDALANEYAKADLFVFPSTSDPWGLVINEAMAAGLPIVTTSAPGAVDDMVRHLKNGLVVPPGDSAALERALVDLLSDPARRAAMGAASARMIQQFSPEACAWGLASAARNARNIA